MKTFFILAFLLAAIPQLTYSQSVVTVPLIGRKVKNILDDFEKTSSRLIREGQEAGNALITSGGNELHVASQNLVYYFDKNRRQIFDDLSPREQNLFSSLNEIITETNNMSGKAYELTELVNLDLMVLTQKIKILDRSSQYYISSIIGNTFLYKNSDYTIKITGIGFGLNNSDYSYTSEVYIGTTKLEDKNLDPTIRRGMIIKIPNNLIINRFKKDSIVTVPVTVKTRIKKKGIIKDDTSEYKTSFDVILMPIVAATVTVTEQILETTEAPLLRNESVTYKKGECSTDKPCYYKKTVRVPDFQVIDIVKDACSGQCRWVSNVQTVFSEGRRVVDLSLKYDGENELNYTFILHCREFGTKTVKKNSDPIDLQYGQPFMVQLDAKNPDCNYYIMGSTFSKEKIEVTNSSIPKSKQLKLLGIGKPAGSACIGQFELIIPKGYSTF